MAWGNANGEHRVDVDFTRLIQMCRFDCAHTLYKFCGQVNRRKFGVPMGGFMSPGLAILCCAMVEMEMEQGPEGLWLDLWTMCLVYMLWGVLIQLGHHLYVLQNHYFLQII